MYCVVLSGFVSARNEAVSRLIEEIATPPDGPGDCFNPERTPGFAMTLIVDELREEHRDSPSRERWSKPMTPMGITARNEAVSWPIEEIVSLRSQ